MFQKYSKLFLPGQYGKVRRAGQYMSKDAKQKSCTPPHCPTEGQTGDSDLRLHHIPENFELLNQNKVTLR